MFKSPNGGVLLWVAILWGASRWNVAAEPPAVAIAREGQPLLKIVLDSGRAIPAERTAAEELRLHLSQMTGGAFEVVEAGSLPPNTPAIFVGDTDLARKHGIDPAQLGPEESVLRTVDGRLILAGGRPRGTLYGVYELLENHFGCRWYTPWCAQIPHRPSLVLPPLNERIKPYYAYRANYCYLYDERMYADQEGFIRFMVRNRQNLQAPPEWGGGVERGRFGSHSFAQLMPTERYFQDHPEYFSERNGKREPASSTNGNHLCLTNPEVLQTVIAEVKKDCRDYPNATYVSVSINDGGNPTICDCASCRAVAQEEGESGLLLQFVNTVADAIREEFPDKFILTLAYNPTGDPPKRLRARANVIVYVCRGGRTALCWFPKGRDAAEFEALRAWSRFAPHVWVWDYANAIYRGLHFFRPLTWQMADQFQMYRELGSIDGVFQENEFHGGNDVLFPQFYELNLWLFAHLCQNPDQSLDGLIEDFLAGYYGPAAPDLRRYVDLLETRRSRYPFRLFDYAFAREAQTCFDEAEAAVQDDPELRGRIRDLRLHLDLATVAWRNDIVRDYLSQGNKWEDYPFRLPVLRQRLRETLSHTTHPYLRGQVAVYRETGEDQWAVTFEPVIELLKPYVETVCSGKEYAPLPEQFRDLPAERLIDLTGATFGWNSSAGPEVVVDPEAALGLAARRLGEQELPMPIGVYSLSQDPPLNLAETIQPDDIPGPGYHWYKGPRFAPGEWTYVYLTQSWRFQEHLWTEYDPRHPQQEWEVYVSMKATGPAYPHGQEGEPNGVWFDRMILVPVGEGGKGIEEDRRG